MSGAQKCIATANEAPGAMKQATPVRPFDAQRNGCSRVVDTTAGLRQAKFSELPIQPLSSDRQVVEGGVGEARASIEEDMLVGAMSMKFQQSQV